MREHKDPVFRATWLMTICLAFGLAFMMIVGSSGCTVTETTEPPPPDVEVSGGELPVYDDDDDVDVQARTEADVASELDEDRYMDEEPYQR